MEGAGAWPVRLRDELRRALALLEAHLHAQRERGRTAATDALRGVVIEEGEAEGLVAELSESLARPPPQAAPPPAHRPDPGDLASPLDRAAAAFGLTPVERDALVLSLAVELDARFARLTAYLNDHAARTRPTVGLVLAVTGAAESAVELCERSAVREGLLLVEGDGPLPGLSLRIAPLFLPRLAAPHLPDRLPDGVACSPIDAGRLDRLVLAEEEREALRRWADSLREGRAAPLLIAGAEGSGRATRAHAACSLAGRSLVTVTFQPDRTDRLSAAVREARWRSAALLVRIPGDARERDLPALLHELARLSLPIALATSPGMVEAVCAASPVEPALVRARPPTAAQRDELWRLLIPPGSGLALGDEERARLAALFDFPPRTLARAARRASVSRGDETAFDALVSACRALGSASVGPIAQRLPQPFTRADLVLPPALLAELDLAAAWLRHRRRVFEDWGLGRRVVLGRGLTALFGGEPGTGKTMAAQVLARELGLELFRVDLSRLMSKYIGETEKNLSALFDEARASGAILFFDEADAIFGKRTEVKDAHDRYANLEIGYLLQRIEEHEGTTLLATNRMRDLDEAFTRRFHFILEFPVPRAPDRRRIWEGMLPPEAARDVAPSLDALARDHEVPGGEIRNSVLTAAFMAASEGAPLTSRHLKRGLLRELLKTGRVLDAKQRRALEEG
jgi:hypothetical protein